MATDGKYATLAQTKQYLIGTRTDPNNPTVFNQSVSGTPDDALISDCLLQAEAEFEMMAGTGYDQQTLTAVQPIVTWADADTSMLHLLARERGPVTNVSAVKYMDLFGQGTTWQTLTWDATGTPPNGIIYPPGLGIDTSHPWPEAWHVRIIPSNPTFGGRATGQLLCSWTYTGGFAVIPQSLQTLIMRMATFKYKLREIPVGRVINLPLGTAIVPTAYSKDIVEAVNLWKPKYG